MERHHFAYQRYINMVAQQAYLLLLSESSDELPPWEELVRAANQVFEIFDSRFRDYLRKLQHYTEEVDYQSKPSLRSRRAGSCQCIRISAFN